MPPSRTRRQGGGGEGQASRRTPAPPRARGLRGYDFEGLASVQQIRRLIEIAALDTLGLENSVARSRTLAYLAQVGLKALEAEELRDRIEALEAAQ